MSHLTAVFLLRFRDAGYHQRPLVSNLWQDERDVIDSVTDVSGQGASSGVLAARMVGVGDPLGPL